MKKYLLTTVLAALIVACGGKHEDGSVEVSDLNWGMLQRDTTIMLSATGNSPKAELHLIIYYIKDEGYEHVNDSLLRDGVLVPDYLWHHDTLTTAQQAADTYIRQFAEDYRRDYGSMYRSDAAHAASYDAQFTCKTSVHPSRDGIVNYMAETYYYGGGQHGVDMITVKNIDTDSRHILRASDIFVPGFEDRLTDLVVEQLCHDRGLKTLEELRSNGFFVGLEPYATQNFLVGKSSITFIYGDSEIAPHEEGIVRVEIANSKLKGIMK